MRTLYQLRMSSWTFCLALIFLMSVTSCEDRNRNNDDNRDSKDVAQEMNKPAGDATKESDERFLVRASEISMEEIRLGQLAEQKATHADVKALAQMMIKDHNKAKDDIQALASRKGIAVPSSPTNDSEDAYRKLNEKAGHDFDREYCNKMISGHKDAIDLYENATQGNNDPDVKSFATTSLETLRHHLAQAQSCEDKLKLMDKDKK